MTMVHTQYHWSSDPDSTKVDTTVIYYNRFGRLRDNGFVATLTVDSDVHGYRRKTIWSSGFASYEVVFRYGDSATRYSIMTNDTVYSEHSYYKNGAMYRKLEVNGAFHDWSTETIILSDNFLFKRYLEKEVCADTSYKKFRLNKLLNWLTQYEFNKERKCWFVSARTYYRTNNSGPKRVVARDYSEYSKQYYKTITRYKYNHEGRVISERRYDAGRCGDIKEQVIYLYEYW